MSGIIYEVSEEESVSGSVKDDVQADILEDSASESAVASQTYPSKIYQRPKSAMSKLEGNSSPRSGICISDSKEFSSGQKKRSIHWSDKDLILETPRPHHRSNSRPSSTGSSSPATSVSNFRRSLKLLGLPTREFGIQEQHPVPHHYGAPSPPRRVPQPTFSTRLRGRSVSLDDLREAARDGKLAPALHRDGNIYKLISNAVYEEWYFRKQQEAADKKRELKEAERRKAEELEKRKNEMRRRSQEKFDEWLEEKTRQRKANFYKTTGSTAINSRSAIGSGALRVTPERAQQAYQDWLKSKEQTYKNWLKTKEQKKLDGETRLPNKHVKDENQERREDAAKAYQLWKQRVMEAQRREEEKKRRQEEKKREKEREKAEEKKESSRRSFEVWKAAKEDQMKKAERKERLKKERNAVEEENRREQRQYEAQQAFLAWLDEVDERENVEAAQTRLQHKSTPLRFPPGRRHSCAA